MQYEYTLEGLYFGEWEELTTEDTRKEALERKREYQENEGGAYRIRKHPRQSAFGRTLEL